MSSPKQYTLTFLGDVMLGRLIDQLLPMHVDEPSEALLVSNFRTSQPHLRDYNHATPWGNSIPLLQSSDLVLANLETSATTHSIKWPDKIFNYRMHPGNVKCLTEAGVDYVSLANNHSLDFGEEGLFDTVRTVKAAGIQCAGAGESEAEASSPAVLGLSRDGEEGGEQHRLQIHAHSFSDHPKDWRGVKAFNLIDCTAESRARIKTQLLASSRQNKPSPALRIVSVHWGPNYAWHPSREIVQLAHFLVDECDVDIVHGHSSHHIQGVELYRSKLILYGCGDFVDDYAVHDNYRNDLSAVWRVTITPADAVAADTADESPNAKGEKKLDVVRLEVFPNRIRHFQAGLIDSADADHTWVCDKFRELCDALGTKVESNLGDEGQMIVNLTAK